MVTCYLPPPPPKSLMSNHNKVDRKQAAFTEQTDDPLLQQMRADLADREQKVQEALSKIRQMREQLQQATRAAERLKDQTEALAAAIASYDRAMYDMRNDPHWEKKRFL